MSDNGDEIKEIPSYSGHVNKLQKKGYSFGREQQEKHCEIFFIYPCNYFTIHEPRSNNFYRGKLTT